MASEFRGIEVFQRSGGRRRLSVSRPRIRLGVLSLCAALLTTAITIAGISWAIDGRYTLATWLAYLATGLSVVAVLCGAAAVVTGRGRVWGAVALVLGIFASPPLLTELLRWVGGLG